MLVPVLMIASTVLVGMWLYSNRAPDQPKPESLTDLIKVKTCKTCRRSFPVSHYLTVRSVICNGCTSLAPRKRPKKRSAERRIYQNQLSRIRTCLKQAGVKLTSKDSKELLGTDSAGLIAHLEKSFSQGMTRENYGANWHVDHKIPISAFNLTNPKSRQKAFNYLNLQPMFILDNISKGCRLT